MNMNDFFKKTNKTFEVLTEIILEMNKFSEEFEQGDISDTINSKSVIKDKKLTLILPGRNKANTSIIIENNYFVIKRREDNTTIDVIPLSELIGKHNNEDITFDVEFKDGILTIEFNNIIKKPKVSEYKINLK